MTPVALVTVNPAVVLAVTNVKYAPLLVDSAGSVHEGLPLVERLIQTLPESAEVKTIVAPTKALSCTARTCGPLGALVNAGAAPLKVSAPLIVVAPPNVTVLLVEKPLSWVNGS